jgi:hypothetical protein
MGSLLTLPQQLLREVERVEGEQWGNAELSGSSGSGSWNAEAWAEEDGEEDPQEHGLTQAQQLVHKVLVEAGLTMDWFG